MDLGSAKFEWFPYLPVYGGNRDLPEEEQLRLEIRRMRSLDRTDQISWTQEGVMETWRDQRLQKYLQDDNLAPIIQRLPRHLLMSLRQFMENTRAYKGFVIDGKEETDPIEIYFHLSAEMFEQGALLGEITTAVVRSAALSGDELKNYKEQCDGSKPLTSTALPALSESAPANADTPLAEPVSGG